MYTEQEVGGGWVEATSTGEKCIQNKRLVEEVVFVRVSCRSAFSQQKRS